MPMYEGISRFARVYEHNKDTKFDEEGVYGLELMIDEATAAKLQKEGIKIYNDEEGKFVKIKRKHAIQKSGERIVIGPPEVVGPDGKTPFTENIGNGSRVNVIANIHDWKGTRTLKLNSIQVVEHVPYAGGGSSESKFRDLTTSDGDEKVA